MNSNPIDYKQLFEESPLARLIVSQEKKEHFYVRHANKAAIHYFCLREDGDCISIDGMYLRDFLGGANTTHILQALTVCFESKVSITVQVLPKLLESRQVQSFILSPIFDEDGNVQYVEMNARPPATEQVAVERERDDAISMFTTVFDISDVGFTVTDHHGRFVRVNDKFMEMTGWESIDLMGRELTTIIPQEDYDIAWERHKAALKDEKTNFGEVRILKKNGEIMNTMVTSAMMELSNGRSFRITTVIDVTELKQIEKDLRRAKDEADEANKAKSAFLANMSHELRTPLNAIIGFSEMMINGTLGVIENEHYIDYLGDIKFSAQHLLQIINDVLDMSKIEAGKMPLDEENVDLYGLLESVRRLMCARADKQGVSIRLEKPDEHLTVWIDERLIRQVFLNLVSNAVKFSEKSDQIDMNISQNDNGDIVVTVVDEGIGIPEDRLREVMEPFGQVSDPRLNKGQGTGLGLPIARAMMEMHQGALSIESMKGQGTTVTCVIPQNRVVQNAEID